MQYAVITFTGIVSTEKSKCKEEQTNAWMKDS